MKQALIVCLMCLSLSGAQATYAQQPGAGSGVASSGMEQGEAVVAVRSDVRLAIKGIRATLSDRLTALTREVTAQMPAVRACYSRLIETRPATVGGLRAVIVLEPGKPKPSIEITEVDGADAELTACVSKILKRLELRGIERPAAIEATLSFDNSRARGQAQLEQRQAAFQANVQHAASGGYVGHWQTDGGEIAFDLEVAEGDGEAAAQALVMAVRAGFSGFLDCRRRAGRQGMNPTGEITLEVRVGRDGKATANVQNSTVEDTKRTPGCVEKAVSRLQVEPGRRATRSQLKVTFTGTPATTSSPTQG